MKLYNYLFCMMVCIPLNGFASEHPSNLLGRIGKQLELSGIESFQSIKIEKTSSDVVADIDISTTSVLSGACITKVAQLVFSEEDVDEFFEDQLWLGSCDQADQRNAISINPTSDVGALIKMMFDAKSIFINGESSKTSQYIFEKKSLNKYKGSASSIIFISALTHKDESTLNFAIVTDKEKIFLEITNLPTRSAHSGTIKKGSEPF